MYVFHLSRCVCCVVSYYLVQSQCILTRCHREDELRISLPKDLGKIHFDKVPACMDTAIDPGEFKDLAYQFGAERHPMILAVPMSLHLWSVHQDYPDLLPKIPAPWDWTMPADVIEANHWKFKEDLF